MMRQRLFAVTACALVSGALDLALSSNALADSPAVTTSDWGTAGLLQTPSARMNEAGEASASVSHTYPYTRLNFMLQPLDWFQGGFRYIDVSNRAYGPAALSSSQSYKDKSIDAKMRFWKESRYLPDMAVGFRDIGGTGLFSSEYVVASKRVADFDFNVGLGWGYLGARGDYGNPLTSLDSRFSTRPVSTTAGDFNTNAYFRGRTALFGGVQYQTPFAPLLLKLEYDGNNYQHEPQKNNQPQSTPLNAGIVYRATPSVDLQLGYERGNTVMLGVSFHGNLAHAVGPPKISDPAIEPLRATPPIGYAADWAKVSQSLTDNAGLRVDHISQRGKELIITASESTYRDPSEIMNRAGHVLQNTAPTNIEWFTVANESGGLHINDWSVPRSAFSPADAGENTATTSAPAIIAAAPATLRSEPLYMAPKKPFAGGFSLGYKQSVGGPNSFLLYQISIDGDAEYHFRKDFWASIGTSVRILDNYDKFVYDAPSGLPRVRTYIREYLTTSRYTMPNLQLTKTWQPTQNISTMAYGGMLESMFGGVGGEVLYRPYGSHWALSMDGNQVKQRDFSQGLTFRDYSTFTGHARLYIDTGFHDILAVISAGQYLAKDKGATVDLSRRFKNGVSIGAFVTITNATKAQFGEGSFDKGIYVLMPFDLFMTRSTRSTASFVWDPLTRDGGAMLSRRYNLYDLTSDRGASVVK